MEKKPQDQGEGMKDLKTGGSSFFCGGVSTPLHTICWGEMAECMNK